MEKLSVSSFKKILKEQVHNICNDYNWDFDSQIGRGYSFQYWVAELITSYEQSFETEFEDAVLTSKDLKADIVLEDPTNYQLLICQCKFSSISKKLKPIEEDDVVSFFNRHELFMNRKWVENHGSQEAINSLADYKEKIEDGYSVVYRFISTGEASSRINELPELKNKNYLDRNVNVKCELMDFSGLKDYYIRAQSLEESIPDLVEFCIEESEQILLQEPHRTMVGIIAGNQLRNLYSQHKESLFAYNIRNYLGNRGINSDIKETAIENSDQFFYFNNGISAICTSFDIKENKIYAKNFQIINGAQTVGTIAKCPPAKDLRVLFRLTEGESVKTEKGFNQRIIQFNNTQNAIKVSDFKSNDRIQLWLEGHFSKQKPTKVIKSIRYIRKRSFKRVHGQVSLKLEDFAKIRYSYLYEPTICLSHPRSLWTSEEDGGVYEKSFGINGKLESEWSDENFSESLLAIGFYIKFLDTAKGLGSTYSEFKYLNRLKWHAVSLAGIFSKNKHSDLFSSKILNSEKDFEELWDAYWLVAKIILDDEYTRAMEEKMTFHAFVRSQEKWDNMKRRMTKRILF